MMTQANHEALPANLKTLPLYGRLKEQLRARILNGTYPPHSRMPSESELGRAFDVSRITVRRALGDLQKEGLIFRVHGKGTFVSRPKAFQNVSTLQGLAESLSQQGYEVINQVHGFRYLPAPAAVAERLELAANTTVGEIRRVRLINRQPVSLEITYLPELLAQQLEKADLVARDIFLIIENDCETALGHAELAIDAVLADEDLSLALDIPDGAPVMRIERLTHDSRGTPLDFEYLYYRGDAFQYRLRIDRQRSKP
jgi:GntR family transcriptional regulator